VVLAASACGPPAGPGVCGGEGARWQPGTLEIHHFDVGQADATLFIGPTGRTLLVDLGETGWDRRGGAEHVGAAIERLLGCRRLDAALVTHFHLDHVGAPGQGGLSDLVFAQGFSLGRLWHRDLFGHRGAAGATQAVWRDLLASPAGIAALHPAVVRPGMALDLGPGVALEVVAADGPPAGDLGDLPSPPDENDYSVALRLRFGQLDYYLGGDLPGEHAVSAASTSHDLETEAARRLPDVDVYRVSHHGSDHASNATLLAQLDPEVAIISVGAANPHGHPGAATLARLQRTAAVYLTAGRPPRPGLGPAIAAGDLVLRSADGRRYTVGAQVYEAHDPVRIDGDGDGYFREADPDDGDAVVLPPLVGGCDEAAQICRE
jgi:glyoxylase-like metal-dependent hydrolase (beta-lactamase superfamily II)